MDVPGLHVCTPVYESGLHLGAAIYKIHSWGAHAPPGLKIGKIWISVLLGGATYRSAYLGGAHSRKLDNALV